MSPRKKIVILGGGVGALSTAWHLTNDPKWQDNYEITIHTLGWRLGGKCASSRNMRANARIEEHGIHGFLGCYYNALKMMAECYGELARPPGAPLARMQDAFLPVDGCQFLEFDDDTWKIWALQRNPNELKPWNSNATPSINEWIAGAIRIISALLPRAGPLNFGQRFAANLIHEIEEPSGAIDQSKVSVWLEHLAGWTESILQRLLSHNDATRRLFIEFDYILAVIRGVIADNVINLGFDVIDGENYTEWLKRHGATDATLASPLVNAPANTLFAYPDGDTTLPPTMAAGVYAHWVLRQFVYLGSFAWKFAAGTGETVIAPLYLVLKQRGVKFEFFHSVAAMRLSADAKCVESIDVGVQANVTAGVDTYQPLIEVDGLPCWPAEPRYEQLKQGGPLRDAGVNLESYWTAWPPVDTIKLVKGRDFDHVVFALSIGAVPYVCEELVAASPKWHDTVCALPAIQTQSMQIWLSKTATDLGWAYPEGASLLTASYLSPTSCVADFSHLLPWERWPRGKEPKTLIYFCGPMAGQGVPPPEKAAYPRTEGERVKWQGVQYLQAGTAPMLPSATVFASEPAGDPVSLDFRLLSCHDESDAPKGTFRFEQQFWRANIDPTDRYVTSPPRSTAKRIKPWETEFSNLTIAGDWTYTGINAGCVEGAVISGMLACYTITGSPDPTSIPGYAPHLKPGSPP